MATYRQRKGRWQAIIRRVDLKATKTFDRLGDARAWATAKEREADLADTLPQKMTGTLGALIEKYEREIWPTKRWGASKASALSILRRDLGGQRLEDLRPSVFLQYAKGLKLSPAHIKTRISYLREVMKTAKALWGVTVPLEALNAASASAHEMSITGKTGVRTRRPTQAELDKIVELAITRPQAVIDLAPIVQILSVLPLRLGELLNLEWKDLNKERRTAVIRSRKHPDIRVKETNTQEVPLITFGGFDTFSMIADRPGYYPKPFPYKRASVSTAFHQTALRCQIVDLHLHDLRAYALTRLLEAGVPIPQVALISGHRNWKVLARHYARIDPTSIHDTLRRLD